MSYKVEARCCGNDEWITPKFRAEAVRFETKKEAKQCARDVESRWSLCAETRIVSCDEPPNVRFNPITFRCEDLTPDGVACFGAPMNAMA
jgi:hypothetical protein